jgi:hypothetical protein
MSQAQYERVAIGAHFLDGPSFAAGILSKALNTGTPRN